MNISTLSRANLVSELLAPTVCGSNTAPLQVSEAITAMGTSGVADSVLAHRLNRLPKNSVMPSAIRCWR